MGGQLLLKIIIMIKIIKPGHISCWSLIKALKIHHPHSDKLIHKINNRTFEAVIYEQRSYSSNEYYEQKRNINEI